MYFRLLRPVIEDAIALQVSTTGKSQGYVLEQIYNRITETSAQYWQDEPQIPYEDPHCRIGYLYRQATANATAFKRVLDYSSEARAILSQAAQNKLNILSMGGRPGTELLGLVKYFLRDLENLPPRRIDFTVIDSIYQWSDTWQQLANATEDEFRSILAQDGVESTTIAPKFLPFDVFDHSQYQSLAGQCRAADLVVFNYLFSENKTRLPEAMMAIEQLANLTSNGCLFIVIDRLEGDRHFNNELVRIFESIFGVDIESRTQGGVIDSDE